MGLFARLSSESSNQLKRSRAATLGFVARTTASAVRGAVSLVQILVVLGLWTTMSELHAGLQRYRELIVADEDLSFTPPKTGVRITYLGTNGYLLQSRNSALLIDLAILGVALPDSRRYFIQALEQLRPRYVLPSHQDDFFSPLTRLCLWTDDKFSRRPSLVSPGVD
jgi:hypothetical protein